MLSVRLPLESFCIAGRLIAECFDDDDQLPMALAAHEYLTWVASLPTTYERGIIR
jgi:hypothetical protein